jgi:hypothetical protein
MCTPTVGRHVGAVKRLLVCFGVHVLLSAYVCVDSERSLSCTKVHVLRLCCTRLWRQACSHSKQPRQPKRWCKYCQFRAHHAPLPTFCTLLHSDTKVGGSRAGTSPGENLCAGAVPLHSSASCLFPKMRVPSTSMFARRASICRSEMHAPQVRWRPSGTILACSNGNVPLESGQ